MTLLLAFFIVLQALSSEQDPGLFYAGQGSFVQALKTMGLGRFFGEHGRSAGLQSPGPRYPVAKDDQSRLASRSIDPEGEDAQLGLQELQSRFGVLTPEASGSSAALVVPTSFDKDSPQLSAEVRLFLQRVAQNVVPALLQQGYLMSIGAVFECTDSSEADYSVAALRVAERVRAELWRSLPARVREEAAARVYSFCRREVTGREEAEPSESRIKVSILLTKLPALADTTNKEN